MSHIPTVRAPTVKAHGLEMPALGFGTWQLSDDEAERAVLVALEAGYRHVDTAKLYDNEEGVGRALRASGLDRDDVWLTTKIWQDEAGRDDVARAIEACLSRLGLDHADLVLLHWPGDVPVEETVQAMDVVRQRGLTRAIGISNHPTDLMRRAAEAGPVFTNQVEYHPFLDQDPVVTAARDLRMTVTAYSPIAQGKVFSDDVLGEIADSHGRDAGQVALRWLLNHDGVAAIPRSGDPAHIASNLDVDFTLDDAERERIDDLPKDRRLVDPPFAPDWD